MQSESYCEYTVNCPGERLDSQIPGVTEYSDPPENPDTGPDFTENKVPPH